MNSKRLGRIVAALTVLAWAVLIADAILSDAQMNLTDGLSMLVGCVAVAGFLALAGRALARPATDVYEMGEAAGRRQAKIDAAVTRSGGTVTPIRRQSNG